MATIFGGLITDRFSPRIGVLLGAGLTMASMGLFQANNSNSVFVGFIFLSLAGGLCSIPAFTLESYVPRHRAMVMASIIVLLNSSPAVFLIIKQLHEYTDLSLRSLLVGYGVLSMVTGLVCGWSFLSCHELRVLRAQQNKSNELYVAVADPSDRQSLEPLLDLQQQIQSTLHKHGRHWGAHLRLPRWLQGVRGWGYFFSAGYLVFLSLPINAYIGTFKDQLLYLADNVDCPEVERLVSTFNIVLPIGSAISGLLVGPLAMYCDRHDLDAVFQAVGWLLAVALLSIQTWGSLHAQIFSVYLYPLVFVCPWVALSEFLRRWYPVNFRGTLFGVVVVFVALIGFFQYPLNSFALQGGGSYFWYNVVMLVCIAMAGSSPLYLAIRRQHFRTKDR